MKHASEHSLRVRRAALVLTSLAIALPGLACGASGFAEESFVRGCEQECTQTASGEVCTPYCGCSYDWVVANDKQAELQSLSWNGEPPMPPLMVDLMAACGSDVYDESFMASCVRDCALPPMEEAECRERCGCMLGVMRGAAPRPASTRFLIENCDAVPPTPACDELIAASGPQCVEDWVQ